jgi:hypothetical protein
MKKPGNPMLPGAAGGRWIMLVIVLSLVAPATLADETVAFNTESKKYHCLDCQWAKKCTQNCIRISLSEARRRGGVACKVCGGTCARSNLSKWVAPQRQSKAQLLPRSKGLRLDRSHFLGEHRRLSSRNQIR